MRHFKAIVASLMAVAITMTNGQTYSCSQMQALAGQYFSSSDVTNMICISYYESSWNTQAYNPSSASGLWQILTEHCGELCTTCTTPSDLFNPDINAQCAASVLAAQGLNAWTTWSSGDCSNWSQCGSTSSSGSSSSGSSGSSSSTSSGSGSSSGSNSGSNSGSSTSSGSGSGSGSTSSGSGSGTGSGSSQKQL